ncbi:MAG: VWA domain-containing protein [Haloarculaceae archaeon]
MSSDSHRFGGDERGVSEIVGYTLLIGIVVLGASLTVVFGSSAITNVRDQTQTETARVVMQEFDSRLGTLASLDDVSRVEIKPGNMDLTDVTTTRNGRLNLTANGSPDCHTSIPLTAIHYESNSGDTVALEAGGVFTASETGASSMLTAPEVTFNNGTIGVDLVNITHGRIQGRKTEAVVDVNASHEETTARLDSLLTGECKRPDNATLSIQSEFYRAWAEYLRAETGRPVDVFDSNRTVRVFFPQGTLPKSADDQRNHVINVSTTGSGTPAADYMDTVNIESNPPRITVDKGVSNRYTVTVRPLDRQLDIGDVKEVETTQNVQRRALDVYFVMDKSGSMGDPAAGSYSGSKEGAAKAGARGFLGDLADGVDRAGVIAYDTDGHPVLTPDSEQYISTDFGPSGPDPNRGVNGSIDSISSGGNTHINEGLDEMNRLYDLTSNQTRNRVAILLTDGKNTCGYTFGCSASDLDRRTREAAREAANNSVTIYTIGYGPSDEIADGLLQNVAHITGGKYYHASDSDELQRKFEKIAEDIQTHERIVHTPITTNFEAGGRSHPPNIAGNTADMARYTSGSQTYLNINDPTAPSLFAHTFAISGGESVDISASTYDCERWGGTTYSRTHNGHSYEVARCAELDDSSRDTLNDNEIKIYTDGDAAPPTRASADWQTPLRDTLAPYLNGSKFDLESNQLIVVYDFGHSGHVDNRLAVMYQVGQSERTAGANVFDLNVKQATLDN